VGSGITTCVCHPVSQNLRGSENYMPQERKKIMGYYVLACDEDGEFVATIKLHSQEEAERCAHGFVNSPSFSNVEIVKVVKHVEKEAAADTADGQELHTTGDKSKQRADICADCVNETCVSRGSAAGRCAFKKVG